MENSAPILIVGGSGGTGSALAQRLTDAGRRVHIAGRNEGKLSGWAATLGADYSVCDVLDPGSLRRSVEAAASSGALAGLAYAVGSIVLKPLSRAEPNDFDNAFALNVVGAAQAVRFAQPALAAAGGAVLLFSTVAVAQGFANHAIISAAKGGVEGLTRALAAELAPKIRVNCVAPSLTRTPLAEPLTANPTMAKAIADMHPLRRLGDPADLAAIGAFLLGPDAGWITGQIVGVDGGRSCLRVKD